MNGRVHESERYQVNPVVIERIWLERLRQKDLFNRKQISFDCASPIVSPDRKLRVATEELGEVAQAIDELESLCSTKLSDRKTKPRSFFQAHSHLREELTQLAAVAIAWLESLEEK